MDPKMPSQGLTVALTDAEFKAFVNFVVTAVDAGNPLSPEDPDVQVLRAAVARLRETGNADDARELERALRFATGQ